MVNGYFEKCTLSNYDKTYIITEDTINKAEMDFDCQLSKGDHVAFFKATKIFVESRDHAWFICQSYD